MLLITKKIYDSSHATVNMKKNQSRFYDSPTPPLTHHLLKKIKKKQQIILQHLEIHVHVNNHATVNIKFYTDCMIKFFLKTLIQKNDFAAKSTQTMHV